MPVPSRPLHIESQEKLTDVAEKRAEVEHIAYERQKELTDRAIKLAEIGKPNRIGSFRGCRAQRLLPLAF